MAILDDATRNRYTRDADTAQALTEDQAQWAQIDELETLHTELLTNLGVAKKHFDQLVEADERDDAGEKLENRTEGVALTMRVATGLTAWATGQAGQKELLTALAKITKSKLDKESELEYSQHVSRVYLAAAPVKAELVKYFVPTAVTDKLGELHTLFEGMRGNGRLTQTQATAARKALKAALALNDRRKTGVYDRMRVYLRPFKYGNPELYNRLTQVMQTVDRRGRKKGAA